MKTQKTANRPQFYGVEIRVYSYYDDTDEDILGLTSTIGARGQFTASEANGVACSLLDHLNAGDFPCQYEDTACPECMNTMDGHIGTDGRCNACGWIEPS
jgi:hypothetical protein